jgi:hypothetical protein
MKTMDGAKKRNPQKKTFFAVFLLRAVPFLL